MKQSALYDLHVAEGATLVEAHGWGVPRSYGDVDAEFEAAMHRTAFTDLSAFGRIEVTGNDRLDLLHRLSTNDLSHAAPGGVTSTLFVTDRGRIIDRVVVIVREGSLILVTSPGAEASLISWIENYTITEDIKLSMVTEQTTMICLMGPEMNSLIVTLTGHLPAINSWEEQLVGGVPVVVAIRQENCGMIAFLIVEKGDVPSVWRRLTRLTESGGGGLRIGSAAYEAYRIALGIPARGGELTEEFNPYDAGLRGEISFTKGCYIGQEVVARLDTYQKTRRRLTGLLFDGGPPVPPGQPLMRGDRREGILTSVAPMPVNHRYLALGVVTDAGISPGDTLTAGSSGQGARVTNFPIEVTGG